MLTAKNKPIIFTIFGIDIVVGIVLIVLGFLTEPDVKMDDGASLKFFFFVLGTALIMGPLILGTIFYIITNSRKRLIDKLKTNGVRGSASVVSVSPVLGKLNNLRKIEIEMDVNVPGKIPYRIKHIEYLDIKNLDSVKPGMVLNILVDRNNQNKMMIVW